MAGMTKEDRAEYETRLASVGYWRKLSHEQALNYGLTSKREFLATERAKEAAALAELNDGERAYAVECLADGATLEDSIEAAKEAAKRLAEAAKEETPTKGNLGLGATFDCMMSKAIANGTYADIAFDETKGKVLSLLSDNETAVVLKRVSGIWEEMDRFQRETYFKGGHWSDCDISRAIHGGF